jgi:alpha-methylacyl-CoA racemase
VGAIEPQFYERLVDGLGLDPGTLPSQMDSSRWPEMKERFAATFRTRTRDEWCAVFEGSDGCVSPVLDLDEVPDHPHNRQRGAYVNVAGVVQPAPAPRFSVTPGSVRRPPPQVGEHTDEVLADWVGIGRDAVRELRATGAVR